MRDIAKQLGYKSEEELKASSVFRISTAIESTEIEYFITKNQNGQFVEYEKKYNLENGEPISKPKIVYTYKSSEELDESLKEMNGNNSAKRINDVIAKNHNYFLEMELEQVKADNSLEKSINKDPYDLHFISKGLEKKESDFGMGR